jgi:hypothetical protein
MSVVHFFEHCSRASETTSFDTLNQYFRTSFPAISNPQKSLFIKQSLWPDLVGSAEVDIHAPMLAQPTMARPLAALTECID